MRTTVIITKRGEGYISTVSGNFGGGHQGARCGLTAYEAAAKAAEYMIQYAQSNPEGGDLMAPPEVLEQVPAHLRSVPSKTALRVKTIRNDNGEVAFFDVIGLSLVDLNSANGALDVPQHLTVRMDGWSATGTVSLAQYRAIKSGAGDFPVALSIMGRSAYSSIELVDAA